VHVFINMLSHVQCQIYCYMYADLNYIYSMDVSYDNELTQRTNKMK
jgi:hypothetical protein